jgi:hypothetical protein
MLHIVIITSPMDPIWSQLQHFYPYICFSVSWTSFFPAGLLTKMCSHFAFSPCVLQVLTTPVSYPLTEFYWLLIVVFILTTCSRALYEKLTVNKLLKEFVPYMETKVSLPCSEELTNAQYIQPDEPSLHPISLASFLILFFRLHLSLPNKCRLSFRFSDSKFRTHF